MKIRAGFVSNSSSSSFVFDDKERTVFEIAELMIPRRQRNDDDKLLEAIAGAKDAGIDPNTPIIFSSCNYDTNIWAYNGKIYITSCNNVYWDLESDGAKGYGEGFDCADEGVIEEVENFFPEYWWDPMLGVMGQHTYDNPTNCTQCQYGGNVIIRNHDGVFCGTCEAAFIYGNIHKVVVLGPIRTRGDELISKPLSDPCGEDEKIWMHILVPEIGPILYDGETAHKVMFAARIGEKIELSTKILDEIQTKAKF